MPDRDQIAALLQANGIVPTAPPPRLGVTPAWQALAQVPPQPAWPSATPARPQTGMLTPGNIDLEHRPIARNPDGSISTVRSMSVEIDGRHFLLPTVSPDGRVLPDDQAVQLFRSSGQNLGEFASDADADAYAQRLHEAQARYYAPAPRYEDLQPLQDRFFQQRDEEASRDFYANQTRRLPDQQAQAAPDPLHTPLQAQTLNLARLLGPGNAYDAAQDAGRIAQGENAWADLGMHGAFTALPFFGARGGAGELPAPRVAEPTPIYRGLNQPYDAERAALLGDRWWHTNPEVASTYAPGAEGAHVIPGLMNENSLNLARIDAPGSVYSAIPVEALPRNLRQAFRNRTHANTHEIAAAAESAGYDGATFAGVRDSTVAGNADRGLGVGDEGRSVVLFNDRAVRSPFASGDLPPPRTEAPDAGQALVRQSAGAQTAEMHPAFANMTRQEFLGTPRITTNRNAADLKPKALTTVADQASEPFLTRFTVRMSPDGAAVYDGERVIASYNFGDTLVVDPQYRRQGVAQELVYQWRTRYPAPAVARERTRASQAIQEQVWDRISRDNPGGGNSGGGRTNLLPDGGGAVVEPIDVFHGTPRRGKDSFLTFSHHGTRRAALDRLEETGRRGVLRRRGDVLTTQIAPGRVIDLPNDADAVRGVFSSPQTTIAELTRLGTFTEDELRYIREPMEVARANRRPGEALDFNGMTPGDEIERRAAEVLTRKGVVALRYQNAFEHPGSYSYVVPDPANVRVGEHGRPWLSPTAPPGEGGNGQPFSELGREGQASATPLTNEFRNQTSMFAGPSARTANHEALARAQEMTSQGVPRDQIWRDTGWFRGVDGKWRFEIDDSGAQLAPRVAQQFETGKPTYTNIQGGFDHPALYDAYSANQPFMGDFNLMRTKGNRPAGTYRDTTDEITVVAPDADIARSGTLHEAQHAVQRREGFARGGMPETSQGIVEQPMLDAIRAEKKTVLGGRDPYAIQNRIASGYPIPSEDMDALNRWRELTRQEDAILANMLPGKEAYRRLAGEAEARNVQTRRDFMPEERRARPPWETQDVPDDQQIVRFDGGDVQYAPPLNAQQISENLIRILAGLGGMSAAYSIAGQQQEPPQLGSQSQ